MKFEIIDYNASFSQDIARLFFDAIHNIDDKFYSKAQKEVWAPTPINYDFWQKRLAVKKPYIARGENKLVGFIELEPDGHIDCFYVAPAFQGKGVVSTALYNHLEHTAHGKGIADLYVEASYPARSFFLKQGFKEIRENKVSLADQVLTNFTMKKKLARQ